MRLGPGTLLGAPGALPRGVGTLLGWALALVLLSGAFSANGAKQSLLLVLGLLPGTPPWHRDWRHSRAGTSAERGDGFLEHDGHIKRGPLPPHHREWARSRDDQKQSRAGTQDRRHMAAFLPTGQG